MISTVSWTGQCNMVEVEVEVVFSDEDGSQAMSGAIKKMIKEKNVSIKIAHKQYIRCYYKEMS